MQKAHGALGQRWSKSSPAEGKITKDITHTALSPLQCKICSCPKLKQTTHPSPSARLPEDEGETERLHLIGSHLRPRFDHLQVFDIQLEDGLHLKTKFSDFSLTETLEASWQKL